MIRQYYEEWPDEVAQSKYPFVDTATLVDNGRKLELLPSYIRDAKLWPNTSSSRVYLRSIQRTPDSLTFVIADNDAVLMSALVRVEDLTLDRKTAFLDVNTSSVAGWIRFAPGALADIFDRPSGTYRYAPRATEFVSSAVTVVQYSGVTGFVVGDTVVSGDVTLFGGRGIELEVDGGEILVNALGDPFVRRDICAKDGDSDLKAFFGALLNPVRRIAVTYSDSETPGPSGVGTWLPNGGELSFNILDGAIDPDLERPIYIFRIGRQGELWEYIHS